MLELLLYKRVAKLIQEGISIGKLSESELVEITKNMVPTGPQLGTDTIADAKLEVALDLVQMYSSLSLVGRTSKFITDLNFKRMDAQYGSKLWSDLMLLNVAAKTLYKNILAIASINIMPTLIAYYSNYLNGSFDEASFMVSLTNKKLDVASWSEKKPIEVSQTSLYEIFEPKDEEGTFDCNHISSRFYKFNSNVEGDYKRVVSKLDSPRKFTEFLRHLINLLKDYNTEDYEGAIKVITHLADKIKIKKSNVAEVKPENQMVILPISTGKKCLFLNLIFGNTKPRR